MNNKLKILSFLILLSLLITTGFLYKKELNKEEEFKKEIGQMFIIGFRGTEVSADSPIIKAMDNLNIGGVILFNYDVPSKSFPRNIIDPEQTKKLIQDLQMFSPTPLFAAVDAEGGLINRLKEKYGFITVPSAQEMGERNNSQETQEISRELAQQLRDLGFNLNFAPVVDVNINPENPVIGSLERSFSEDPEKVLQQAKAFIQGHQENNIITALKHFPGHGSSSEDSHLGMVDITNTYNEKELLPYQNLINDSEVDIDMIMTAHIVNREIDPDFPATLSPLFLQDILRNQLNFEGVIVSDDMQMKAIEENYGFEESVIKAINAGCDILIISNNGQSYSDEIIYQVRDIVFEAVKKGKISKERIEQSLERINQLKKKYKIITD